MKFEPTLSELSNTKVNGIGILNIPDTEFESKLSLLYILLNTQEGEKIMDYDFGIKLTSQTFESINVANLEAFEFELIEMIKNKVTKYIPDFELSDLEAFIEGNFSGPNGALIIKCLWVYRKKWMFNSFSVVKPNNKFGTLLSTVTQYEINVGSPSDVVSRKIMTNIVNNIKLQLSSKELEDSIV